MAVNYFKHTITDGIVHHEDQPKLAKYVVATGDRSTPIRADGKKQGGLHDIRLTDGKRVKGDILKQKQLVNHYERNLIKVKNRNDTVRYYKMIDSVSITADHEKQSVDSIDRQKNKRTVRQFLQGVSASPRTLRRRKSIGAGISRESFDAAKRKWGSYSSWAVWAHARPDMPAKDGIGDVSVLDPDMNPTLLSTLNPNIVLLGLNAADRQVNPVPWGNFHDDYMYSQDYKTRYALYETPLWGSYMTDLFVGLHQTDSSTVLKWAKANPEGVKRHMRRLEEELKDIGADKPLLIAFGGTSYRLANQFLGHKYNVEKLTHYSAAVRPDALRQEVLIIADKYHL